MIALLGLLARLSVILGFAGLAFASISDLIMKNLKKEQYILTL